MRRETDVPMIWIGGVDAQDPETSYSKDSCLRQGGQVIGLESFVVLPQDLIVPSPQDHRSCLNQVVAPPDPNEPGLAGGTAPTVQRLTRRTAGEPVAGGRGNGPPGPLTGRSTSRTGHGNGGGRAAGTRAAADPHPPEEQAAPGEAAKPEEREDWDMVEMVEADSRVDIPQGDPEILMIQDPIRSGRQLRNWPTNG
jgi:hypothetical protein